MRAGAASLCLARVDTAKCLLSGWTHLDWNGPESVSQVNIMVLQMVVLAMLSFLGVALIVVAFLLFSFVSIKSSTLGTKLVV